MRLPLLRRSTPMAWWMAAALTLAGCGLNVNDPSDTTGGNDAGTVTSDGSASATSSGVGSSLTLGALTTDQASALCDWTNMKQGGYGRRVACADGTAQATNATNLACVNQTRSIGFACATLTVGDIEGCTNAVGADLCKFPTASACAAVHACAP